MIRNKYTSVVEEYHSICVDSFVHKEKLDVLSLARKNGEGKLSKAEVKRRIIERLDRREGFLLRAGDRGFLQKLEFARSRAAFNGVRLYFNCPASGCNVTPRKLYASFYGGGYACRYCHNLSYYLQTDHKRIDEGIIHWRASGRKLEEFRAMMKEKGRRWSKKRIFRHLRLAMKYKQDYALMTQTIEAMANDLPGRFRLEAIKSQYELPFRPRLRI